MLPVALRSLRHRNFRLFAAGQIVSLTGTWVQLVAQSWLVYRLTGRATLLGLVGFAGQIPIFVLAPLGGAIADRFERRRILVVTQSIAMVLAFVLAALAGPRVLPLRSPQPFAPTDSTEAVPDTWMADVTMEPIRVVIPRDWRMEAVTMEPIRVVIPLA
ncbi:MAG TPA: MFS transporter, partial [Gemmatimonadota bacterium]|nr:MFS transporter [Gemmatimonadota bacterium]